MNDAKNEFKSALMSTNRDLALISTELDRVITEKFPQLQQSVKWGNACYSANNVICAIVVHKNQVNLQIFQGAHLKDAKLLSGTGKDMRNLPFKPLDEVNSALIGKILKQAIAFDSAAKQ